MSNGPCNLTSLRVCFLIHRYPKRRIIRVCTPFWARFFDATPKQKAGRMPGLLPLILIRRSCVPAFRVCAFPLDKNGRHVLTWSEHAGMVSKWGEGGIPMLLIGTGIMSPSPALKSGNAALRAGPGAVENARSRRGVSRGAFPGYVAGDDQVPIETSGGQDR